METEEDNPISGDELGSQLIGLKSKENPLFKKNVLYGVIVAAAVVVLVVIIIIVAASSNSSNSKGKSKGTKIAEIDCEYNIQKTDQNTIILGTNFKKSTDFDIYINGTLIKYSKEFILGNMHFLFD